MFYLAAKREFADFNIHVRKFCHLFWHLISLCHEIDDLFIAMIFRAISWNEVYRVTSYIWPCVSGTVYKVTFPVFGCTVVYTEQVTFRKVPEQHGHVYLVTL